MVRGARQRRCGCGKTSSDAATGVLLRNRLADAVSVLPSASAIYCPIARRVGPSSIGISSALGALVIARSPPIKLLARPTAGAVVWRANSER
jgi:hypothetical protein